MPSTAPPPASAAAAKKPSKMKRFFTSRSRQNKKGLSMSVIAPSSAPELDDSLDLSNSSTSRGVFTPTKSLTLIEIADRLQIHVEVRDRNYRGVVYSKCFVGSEAVDYLVEHNLAMTRAEAVKIGNCIMGTVGTFESVSRESDFKDGHVFYRFIDPEQAAELLTTYQRKSSTVSSATKSSRDQGGGAGGARVKMDKYGFLIDDEDAAVAPTGATAKINLVRLRADAKKWEGILGKVHAQANGKKSSSVAIKYSINPSKMKYYTRRGLPDAMRQKAWTALTGIDLIIKAHPGKYDELVDKADVEYKKLHNHEYADNFSLNSGVEAIGAVLDAIDRDINRTFPKHYLFRRRNEDEDDSHGSAATESVGDLENMDSEEELDDDEDDFDIQSTGQDPPSFDVEAKKKMFNESMQALMSNMSCEGLNNVDCDCYNEDPNKELKSSLNSEESFDGSVDIFDGEDDNDDDEVNTKGGHSQSQKLLSVEALGMGQGQGSLRRVLRAYSMYDTDVGYCQGMNFIAAMFLTFLSEEESFWLLVVVMNEEPYKLRDMFGKDMAGSHEVLYIAEKLLAQFLPKLARQMEEEMIHVSMFVTPWLLTVYTSTFPFDLVVRVWDSFLVEGWKVVYRVMLSLLTHASKDIAELSFEQILNYFRDFPSTVDGQTIMANSFRIPLKSKHIQNHVTQWRRQGGHKEQTDEGMVSTFKHENSGGAKNSGGASVSSNTSNSLSEKPFPMILPSNLPMRRTKPREIEIENLSEKLLPILGSYKFAVMLHNILSPEECLELIDRAEEEGFEDAMISYVKAKTLHRDCTRCLLDDNELAEVWYKRIVNALKDTPLETKLKNAPWIQKNSGMIPHAVGLNERFRLLKYKQGQFFRVHTDTPFVRRTSDHQSVGEMSCVSVQVYLNQNFKGGCTTFRSEGRYLDVKPRTGSILLFEHDILHEGQAVIQGKKYILRTDVMYSTNSSSNTGGVVSGTMPTEQL
ncbi:hypothetical protein ACHAW5_006074 [Stephanodiscus triporus]|uniref:Uncharacterized protein n=1 Tax=Stephanodiscus triporus TaxID=2934178 RepID=A0ABD3P2L4_9STRA